MPTPHKIPRSVLVLIHTPDLQFLMLKRTAKSAFEQDFWQSVTGSLDALDELPLYAAAREVLEETGLDCFWQGNQLLDLHTTVEYEIFPQWLHRYAAGVTHNVEHQFALIVPNTSVSITLAPQEHTEYQWLPWQDAAALCFSWNNAAAIRRLGAG